MLSDRTVTSHTHTSLRESVLYGQSPIRIVAGLLGDWGMPLKLGLDSLFHHLLLRVGL